MKRLVTGVLAGVLTLAFAPATLGGDVKSLRGDLDLDKASKMFSKKKPLVVEDGFERAFEKQPPLTPHKVKKYRITLRENGCLKCHSEENHEKEKAPAVGESHYSDRQGNKLKTVSKRRHFCNQCHVPQKDAEPLVENSFEGDAD
jgi:nitrate reductase (cytochrome), electron transfer subunit